MVKFQINKGSEKEKDCIAFCNSLALNQNQGNLMSALMDLTRRLGREIIVIF